MVGVDCLPAGGGAKDSSTAVKVSNNDADPLHVFDLDDEDMMNAILHEDI